MRKKPLSLDSVVSLSAEQAWCDLGGEAAILGLTSGVYYGLDEVGARVWALLKKPRSLEAVRDVLLKEYNVDALRCEEDLLRLVGELAGAGLVRVG